MASDEKRPSPKPVGEEPQEGKLLPKSRVSAAKVREFLGPLAARL